MKWPWTKTQEPTRTEDSTLAEVPGSEPTPLEPEPKDEKPACVKCGSYEWVATSPPMATQKRYVKDENGERIELTCWCCGYKWTEPTWDAPAQNEKVSDGGTLTPESKQDANPPFAAPLG